jgi:hypothetical protein
MLFTSLHFNYTSAHNVTPNYAKIKIPNNSAAFKYTCTKIHALKIKDEIRFLYIKKQNLNQKLYRIHLEVANTWGNSWSYIEHTINDSLNIEADSKCKQHLKYTTGSFLSVFL